MSKGDEIALAIGAICAQLKDLGGAGGPAGDLYGRLSAAIRILEDVEGVSRGYYFGSSLELPSQKHVATEEWVTRLPFPFGAALQACVGIPVGVVFQSSRPAPGGTISSWPSCGCCYLL